MGSFFPGMDPYLEDPGGWTGIHDGLIARLRTDLNRLVGAAFVADAGTSVYIVTADEQRWVFPNMYVVEAQREEHAQRGACIAAFEAAAGGWKDVDIDRFLEDNARSCQTSTRSCVDL